MPIISCSHSAVFSSHPAVLDFSTLSQVHQYLSEHISMDLPNMLAEFKRSGWEKGSSHTVPSSFNN